MLVLWVFLLKFILWNVWLGIIEQFRLRLPCNVMFHLFIYLFCIALWSLSDTLNFWYVKFSHFDSFFLSSNLQFLQREASLAFSMWYLTSNGPKYFVLYYSKVLNFTLRLLIWYNRDFFFLMSVHLLNMKRMKEM